MTDRVKTTMTWRREDYEALKEANMELSRYLDTVIDYYKAFEMDRWDLNEGIFIQERQRAMVLSAKVTEFFMLQLSPSQQREAGRKIGEMVKAEAKFQGKDPQTWAEYVCRMSGAGKLVFEPNRVMNINPTFTEHVFAGFLETLLDRDVEITEGAENVHVFKVKSHSSSPREIRR